MAVGVIVELPTVTVKSAIVAVPLAMAASMVRIKLVGAALATAAEDMKRRSTVFTADRAL